MNYLTERWVAALLPAIFGLGASYLCIQIAQRYGTVLFAAVPFIVTFLAAFLYCLKFRRSFWSAYLTSVLSLLILGGFILIFALDGLICLLMAFPLAAIVALGGTALGRKVGMVVRGKLSATIPLLVMGLFPFLVGFEHEYAAIAPERAVKTSIQIKSDVSNVWQTVIAFPHIEKPADGIFRFGIAYPIEARIEGQGVGSIRYCTFSTGSFVEPITHWEENELLAFTVTSSPPPMEEFSLYEHVDSPHLHGHMASHKGQFRLVKKDGHVLLEGTTWYSHAMWPQWYWAPITDEIIHRIHDRVLTHIKDVSENKR